MPNKSLVLHFLQKLLGDGVGGKTQNGQNFRFPFMFGIYACLGGRHQHISIAATKLKSLNRL